MQFRLQERSGEIRMVTAAELAARGRVLAQKLSVFGPPESNLARAMSDAITEIHERLIAYEAEIGKST